MTQSHGKRCSEHNGEKRAHAVPCPTRVSAHVKHLRSVSINTFATSERCPAQQAVSTAKLCGVNEMRDHANTNKVLFSNSCSSVLTSKPKWLRRLIHKFPALTWSRHLVVIRQLRRKHDLKRKEGTRPKGLMDVLPLSLTLWIHAPAALA